MENLPRSGQPRSLPKAKLHRCVLPAIDWFWVKVAIKGSLAAVIAIVCLRWLHPPGSSTIPLMAWTLTIMGRPALRVGGTGDLRMFQTVLYASLLLAACAVLLLLTTPCWTTAVDCSVPCRSSAIWGISGYSREGALSSLSSQWMFVFYPFRPWSGQCISTNVMGE
jgi:hypothetical protein